MKITYVKNKLMQQKNTSDKQIKNFNVQNNNLHKQVALHHIVFIRSLHQSGSNIMYILCDYKKKHYFKPIWRSFKTVIYGTFLRRMRKTLEMVLIKIMTSTPGFEIRIAFLICYLQSLYEIELGYYFCPEFAGHVTNQNILVDAGKLM